MISPEHVAEVESECAVLRTRMAARRVTRLFDDALRPINLRVTQFTLLAAVKLGRPTSILALSNYLGMEHSTLTRNLRVLERRELIRISAEGPRRARAIELTAAGEALLEKAYPRWRAAQKRVVDRLGRESWQQTRRTLAALATI